MRQPIKIHLVDADAAIRAALTFSLELEGFAVEAHASGASILGGEALPRDGCLVIDARLSDMDGLDCLARLRADGVTVPAILVASTPGRALRARAAAAGAAIVEKPLLCDALTAAIRRAVGAERIAA